MRIVSDSAWIVFSKVCAIIYLTVFNYLLIQSVPLGELGRFFLIYSASVILPHLALFGVNVAAIKEISEYRANGEIWREQHFLAFIRRVVSIGALPLLAASCVLAAFLNWDDGVGLVALSNAAAISIWLISAQIRLMTAGIARGRKDFRGGALVENVTYHLTATGALALAVWLDWQVTLSGALWISAIASVVPLASDRFLLWQSERSRTVATETCEEPGSAQKSAAPDHRGFVNLSFMVMLTTLYPVVLNQGGVLMAGLANGEANAGLYGAAFRIMQVAALPSMVYGILIRPYVAEFVGSRNREIVSKTRFATRIFFLAYLAIAIFLIGFGSDLIAFFFGPDYREMYVPMVILVLGRLSYAMFGPSDIAISFLGDEGYAVRVSYLFTVLFLVVWFVVFDSSIVSIATAVSVVFFFRNLLMWRGLLRRLNWDTGIFDFSSNK